MESYNPPKEDLFFLQEDNILAKETLNVFLSFVVLLQSFLGNSIHSSGQPREKSEGEKERKRVKTTPTRFLLLLPSL